MTGRPLRAGLIGLGQIGQHHARVLHQMDGVDLVAAADPAATVAATLPAHTQRFTSAEELLAVGLDLVVIATPTSTHEELAIAAAAAGVHLLIEKPVAACATSAARICAAVEQAGVIGCVGHIERYNPALQEMRRRLAAGQVGEIYQIATRRQGPFPERIADVGVVLDLASHDLDLTAWVAKRSYRTVSAQTAYRSGRRTEDLVAVVGELDGGVVVNHLVNWLSPLKERVTVVTGERGTLIADTLTADLTFYANGVAPVEWDAAATFRGVVQGDSTRFAFPRREPLLVELEAFRDAVLGLDRRIVSVGDARRTVSVAEAILASASAGGQQQQLD